MKAARLFFPFFLRVMPFCCSGRFVPLPVLGYIRQAGSGKRCFVELVAWMVLWFFCADFPGCRLLYLLLYLFAASFRFARLAIALLLLRHSLFFVAVHLLLLASGAPAFIHDVPDAFIGVVMAHNAGAGRRGTWRMHRFIELMISLYTSS